MNCRQITRKGVAFHVELLKHINTCQTCQLNALENCGQQCSSAALKRFPIYVYSNASLFNVKQT